MSVPGASATTVDKNFVEELGRSLRNMANEPEIGLPKVCTQLLSTSDTQRLNEVLEVFVNPEAKTFEMPERETQAVNTFLLRCHLNCTGADGVKRRKIEWQTDRCSFPESDFEGFYRFLLAERQQNPGTARDGVRQCMRFCRQMPSPAPLLSLRMPLQVLGLVPFS